MHFPTGLAVAVALAGFAVTGCRGKLVASAELHGAGTADAHFQSTGEPLVLWADTDGHWQGAATPHAHFPAHYAIEITSNGKKLDPLSCDSQSASESVCGSEVDIGASHHGDCELRLDCALPALPAGDTVLHVTGTPGSGVSEVKKMSLNVRAK